MTPMSDKINEAMSAKQKKDRLAMIAKAGKKVNKKKTDNRRKASMMSQAKTKTSGPRDKVEAQIMAFNRGQSTFQWKGTWYDTQTGSEARQTYGRRGWEPELEENIDLKAMLTAKAMEKIELMRDQMAQSQEVAEQPVETETNEETQIDEVAKFKPDPKITKVLSKWSDKKLKDELHSNNELPMKMVMHIRKEMNRRMMKEETQIDELKKSTLSKYAQKAFTQHNNRFGIAAVGQVRGQEEHPDDARVRRNRKKGVQRAISKMGDDKYGKKK
jgi:hypothetical protein